jgi:hypothetical protein
MAILVKHNKVSSVPDSADTSLVRPSDWNADHTLTGFGTAAEKDAGVANGVATLDSGGKVPVSELPAAVLGALSYQGTWDASTNTPTITSSVGTKGYYYVVSVAGNTDLNGITDWQVGDWAVYNGTAWQKVDNTDAGGDVVGPSSATDNAVARFDTTTGKLIQNSTTTIDDSGVLSTSKGLIGSGANLTDYPNAQVVSTQSKISGYGHNYRIGLVGEAQGNSSDTTQWGVGVYGKGWTNGDTRSAGLEGDAGVTNSADTGTATAIRAYSKSTHSGGLNVGLTIDVTGSSVGNYALYMQNGNLFSAAAQSWELVDGSNSALRFNATGKTGILDIITTNGAEGIATSGTLNVTGTSTLAGVSGNTITATTKFVSPYYDAANSAGGALRNASGTAQLQWGGGGGNNITFDVAANLNPANAQIDISPTGTGTVRINPATASSMNNVVIGATTPLAASFTDLSVTGTTSFDGSQGTSGQVLTSAGTGATPTWTTPTTGTVTSVDLTAGTGISVSGGPITSSGSITVNNTDTGSSQNIFKNVAVSGQSTIVADTNNDTLTVAAGAGVTLTTDATTDTLTITTVAVWGA